MLRPGTKTRYGRPVIKTYESELPCVGFALRHGQPLHPAALLGAWLEAMLKGRWVRGKPRIVVQTPADPARSCAITNAAITGMAPADLAHDLFEKYRVYAVAINRPEAGILGIRVTPHLFTTTADLDALVKRLVELAA